VRILGATGVFVPTKRKERLMNKAIIIGRLGKEAKFFNGGEQIACRFQLAVKERWKSKNNEPRERTEWVNVVALGSVAEQMKGVAKGTLVFVQGSASTGSYTKEDETRYYFEIRARQIRILPETGKQFLKDLDQNEIALVGRLGQDPVTPKEGITHFSLACNDYLKGQEDTQWISVATFNGLSDNAARILSKGRLVLVDGKVRTRKYDKNGQSRYATGVVAHRWRALDARPKRQESEEYHESAPYDHADDDIPF
jgi:single-strand DNA-binding protein